MTCGNYEQLVALDIAGDLPASETARVRRHLKECASCRTLAEELAADLQWLQTAHREPLDRAVLHQVRVGVMRRLESEQSRWNRPFGGLIAIGWRWQWIVAAAAVAVLLGSLARWSGSLARDPADIAFDSSDQRQLRPVDEESRLNRETKPNIVPADMPVVAPESAGARTTSLSPDPPQLARLDPGPTGASDVRAGGIHTEGPVKIVTALLEEPQGAPTEAVMLKIPTSNPGIIVYWLMDEQEQLELGEENEGD